MAGRGSGLTTVVDDPVDHAGSVLQMITKARQLVLRNRDPMIANARALLRASLVSCAFLSACGGTGDHSSPPMPPAPPAITNIDISQSWVTAQPGDVGMDSVRLARAANDAAAIPRFRSLLVARHGKLVLENYFAGTDSTTPFDVRSVTKSIVSLLVGDAIGAGKLSLDATVGDYLGAPYALDAGDRAITMRQLLTMTSRYQWNESNGDDYN